MRFLFNLAATKTDTYRCQQTTHVGEYRTYVYGGVTSLTSKFGFAVLRVRLWKDTPDNVVYSRTRFPGTRKGMKECEREVNHWARTGRHMR